MKRILLILVLLTTSITFSQVKTFESEVLKISKKIEQITKAEKAALKEKVEDINSRLEKKEITLDEATKLKEAAAALHAKNIEVKVSVEEQKLQLLVQDRANGKIKSDPFYDDEGTFTIGGKIFRIRVRDNDDYEYMDRYNKRRKRREKWRNRPWNRRTTSQLVFALGVNNVLVDGKISTLDNSNYKFWKSHFYEVGWTFKTRFSKEASSTYFKYGFSFLWNNLRLENNQFHVVNGSNTDIVAHPEALSESRLRNVQLIFPAHIEWDFSRNSSYDSGKIRDRTNRSFRLGLGGYFGFRLGTKQFLEYRNTTGTKVEELQKDNFNVSNFTYGLSTYLSYRSTGVYVKYDLSPLFKGTETRNISIGLRFDIN